MSLDKLVDSTQLDSDLTSVANAIRAKSGGSSQLAFPAGFVSEIGNIPSGGGGLDLPWITSKETVTIGANSITNMAQVKTCFAEYQPYFIAVLKTAPTVNNQAVALAINGGSALRYRGGSIGAASTVSKYDGVLVEGTEYVVYHY